MGVDETGSPITVLLAPNYTPCEAIKAVTELFGHQDQCNCLTIAALIEQDRPPAFHFSWLMTHYVHRTFRIRILVIE